MYEFATTSVYLSKYNVLSKKNMLPIILYYFRAQIFTFEFHWFFWLDICITFHKQQNYYINTS